MFLRIGEREIQRLRSFQWLIDPSDHCGGGILERRGFFLGTHIKTLLQHSYGHNQEAMEQALFRLKICYWKLRHCRYWCPHTNKQVFSLFFGSSNVAAAGNTVQFHLHDQKQKNDTDCKGELRLA